MKSIEEETNRETSRENKDVYETIGALENVLREIDQALSAISKADQCANVFQNTKELLERMKEEIENAITNIGELPGNSLTKK